MKLLFIVISICSLLLLFNCLNEKKSTQQTVTVEPGYEGFLYKPNAGGIDTTQTFNEGTYQIPLDEELIHYSIKQNSFNLDTAINITPDTVLNISAQVNYSIARGQSAFIHLRYGRTYESQIRKEFIDFCKPILSKTEFMQYREYNLEQLASEMVDQFATQMSPKGISIAFLEIFNIDVDS